MRDYIYIIVPFTAAISAQIIKFIGESIKYKKLNWERLFNGNEPTLKCSITRCKRPSFGF